jgi:hypothetical protein
MVYEVHRNGFNGIVDLQRDKDSGHNEVGHSSQGSDQDTDPSVDIIAASKDDNDLGTH